MLILFRAKVKKIKNNIILITTFFFGRYLSKIMAISNPKNIPGKKTLIARLSKLWVLIPPSGTNKWKNNSSPLKFPYVSIAQNDVKHII